MMLKLKLQYFGHPMQRVDSLHGVAKILGIGAMTDFSALLANPKLMLKLKLQ